LGKIIDFVRFREAISPYGSKNVSIAPSARVSTVLNSKEKSTTVGDSIPPVVVPPMTTPLITNNDPELDELLEILNEKPPPILVKNDSELFIEEEIESLPPSPDLKMRQDVYEEDFEEGETDSSDF
jgi:hypothetical protein